MIDLRYDQIEQQLAEALPELRPAVDYYWRTEGAPGSDCGPYIFFEDMFARYVDVLLALPTSRRRDALLRRAFSFVEEMLASGDASVRTLAYIGIYERRSPGWFARAAEFIGPVAIAELDKLKPRWRNRRTRWLRSLLFGKDPKREILDGYGVRHVIAEELRAEGITLSSVPGRTYAEHW